MRLYHVSDQAEAILQGGFVDGTGFYRSGKLHRGVWLSDRPIEEERPYSGPPERTVVIEVPDDVALRHEWLQEDTPYRNFLIPAQILNRYLSR